MDDNHYDPLNASDRPWQGRWWARSPLGQLKDESPLFSLIPEPNRY